MPAGGSRRTQARKPKTDNFRGIDKKIVSLYLCGMKEVFRNSREVDRKHVCDYEVLAKVVDALRLLNHTVVVTIGTWDLLHIGHVRYLRSAKSKGDVLIVGVDTDSTVKKYKGDLRPIVPYPERCEMLIYQDCVDLVTPVGDVDEKGQWQYGLIERIRPDVFVAVEESYPEEQITEIKRHCGEVVILPRQAEGTSTSQMIQNAVKGHLDQMYELINRRQ